jgi:hypothetical protein
MAYFSNITRSEGDPKVIRSGPSSLSFSDRLARGLGWFSIGLGLCELLIPKKITRALGMEGQEGLVRIYGAREIGSGILSLSLEKNIGLWSRVGGDALDIGTLIIAARNDNPKTGNIALALLAVAGISLLDIAGAATTAAGRRRSAGSREKYSNRSGFPKGLEASKGAAKEFQVAKMGVALRARKISAGPMRSLSPAKVREAKAGVH